MSVDLNPINNLLGPHVIFTGANVHIRSGSGLTYGDIGGGPLVNGLGNLIIGYNEGSDDRAGQHNLVIGAEHSYGSSGGLVAGFDNDIRELGATVTGGTTNVAKGLNANISGGQDNTASGENSSISGGLDNSVGDDGLNASILGGGNQFTDTNEGTIPALP